MGSIYIIDRIIERFQISNSFFNISEAMLMLNSINRSSQVLEINKILLNNIKLVVSVNIKYRICHVLQINYFSFNIKECMMSLLNVENRPNQIHQICNFLFYFIKLMFVINSFSDWIILLLQCVKILQYFRKVVLSV